MERDKLDINLQEIFMYILYRWWAIIIAMIICGGLAYGYTDYCVTPMYQSDTMLYVNASTSVGDVTISASDVGSGNSLISTYVVILKTRTTLNEIADEIDNVYDRTELATMISASSVDSTDVLQIKVTNSDPAMAEAIANAVAIVLPEQISEIIEGTSVKIVDTAVIASIPISPDYRQNVTTGAGVGAVLAVILLALRHLQESKIYSVGYLKDRYEEIPVLAVIPVMD